MTRKTSKKSVKVAKKAAKRVAAKPARLACGNPQIAKAGSPITSKLGRLGTSKKQITGFIDKLTKQMPDQHRIFPPLRNAELLKWAAKRPKKSLPEDLVDLLRHTNGIQFWVSEGSPEGYFRLLPMREIDSARKIMWGEYSADLNDDDVPYAHWLAISEHADGANYIVLDTDNHKYYSMDTCGADLTCPVGNNVEELLGYIWESWVKGME